ncbi:MAG TPA: thioredoxin domain-containing protein [Bacteroidales bacterium]|nr:thioredoxin domain-containing protein [Bacteroidales bacterium]
MRQKIHNTIGILIICLCSNFLYSQSSPLIISLNKTDFINYVYDYTVTNGAYNGKLPAIVVFDADYCSSCKSMEKHLKELLQEYDGKLVIYKVDLSAEQELQKDLAISSLPLLYFFPVKGEPKIALGYLNKNEIREIIKEELRP